MDAELVGIAPLAPVHDLDASVAFYRDVLGFRVVVDAPAHAHDMVARDGARIGLQGGAGAETIEATRRHIAAYVLGRDLDALWGKIAPRCEALNPDRFRAPFRQDYGVRELQLEDPDGFLMLFGEAADTNVEEP